MPRISIYLTEEQIAYVESLAKEGDVDDNDIIRGFIDLHRLKAKPVAQPDPEKEAGPGAVWREGSKWRGRICVKGKKINVPGRYLSEEEARAACSKALLEHAMPLPSNLTSK